MTIASNIIAPIAHALVDAAVDIPAVSPVDQTVLDDEGEGPAAVGDVFAGLVCRNARKPAANDATIDADDDAAENDQLPVRADADRGRVANARVRAAMALRLVAARNLSALSQGEVSRAIGHVNQTQLNLWERGARAVPLADLVRLAEALNVSIDYIMGASPEPERDPAAGLRHAMLRGVRTQLTRVAEVVVTEVSRHARLVGADAGSTGQFIAAGAELLDAVRSLARLNPGHIDDMRGGATLAFKAEAFEQALRDAERRQHLAKALDHDLRERLGHLPDGDLDLDETLIGDD
jgi:transcriptional regulator with XRE-family HTH domain